MLYTKGMISLPARSRRCGNEDDDEVSLVEGVAVDVPKVPNNLYDYERMSNLFNP